jgi:peroxiredoxin
MTVPPETPQPPRQKLSPVLLIFLILPVVMLIAAGVMMLNSSAPGTSAIPTPAAVTLPPMPTPISLEDTPILDFELTALDGQTVQLSDYNGRVVFLNFWATWCEPCKREMPTFDTFMAEQPADGAVVLAVNVEESADLVRQFLDEYDITRLTIPMDTEAEVAGLYGVFQLPITYIIDTTGIVRYPKLGEITRAEMDMYLQALAEEST